MTLAFAVSVSERETSSRSHIQVLLRGDASVRATYLRVSLAERERELLLEHSRAQHPTVLCVRTYLDGTVPQVRCEESWA